MADSTRGGGGEGSAAPANAGNNRQPKGCSKGRVIDMTSTGCQYLTYGSYQSMNANRSQLGSILIGSLAAVLIGLTASAATMAGAAPDPAPVVALTTAQQQAAGVRLGTVGAGLPAGSGGTTALQLTGTVQVPNTRVHSVLALHEAHVSAVLVDPGQTVRRGQALMRLQSPAVLTLQREYLGARDQAQVAAAQRKRDESLAADGVISTARLETTQAAAQAAAAAVQERQQLLRLAGMSEQSIAALRGASDLAASYAVHALADGTVLDLTAKVGDAVQPGALLMRLAPLDLLWIDLQATRSQAATVQRGDGVRIEGCPVTGKVLSVGASLDASSQTLPVRAEFRQAAACMAPGQFVKASILAAARAGTSRAVPEAAVLQREGQHFVFVRSEAGFRPVPVTVVRREGGMAWLGEGPAPGTAIAVAGIAALKGRWLGLGADVGGAP